MAKFWRKIRAVRDTLLGALTNGMSEDEVLKAIRNVIIAELAPEIEAAVKDIINSSAMTLVVKENLIDHAEDKLRALFADWADDGKINDSEEVNDKETGKIVGAVDRPDNNETLATTDDTDV